MTVTFEFVLNRIQYQELSEGENNERVLGFRKRTLGMNGKEISDWDYISEKEFKSTKEVFSMSN